MNNKKKSNRPTLSVSIVIATYNSGRTITKCLTQVKKQHYPTSQIEIIAADGGSHDDTPSIIEKFGGRVINVDPKKQNAEYNKAIGLQEAKNEIVLFLDHDNIMTHDRWLKNLMQPFNDHKEVIAVEPLRFHYDPKMTVLDRYFALYGGSDPVVFYLNMNSHLSWAYDTYRLKGAAKDCGSYYIVQFSSKEIPALGGNGAAFRRKLLLAHAKADPDRFIHVDVAADLIRGGFTSYAFTKDSILHLTNNKLFPFLSRRKYFIETYYFEQAKKRRFLIYDPQKNTGDLIKYIVFSLTLVVPLYDALRGYLKIRDWAWFIHPFMCLAFLYIYGSAVIQEKIKHV